MCLEKTAGPVLTALSERRLKQVMPVECKPGQEESATVHVPGGFGENNLRDCSVVGVGE
jgi:hypothetical protein